MAVRRGCSASWAAGRRWTACPPNWLRSAATAFMVGESSWREEKRANSEAAIVGMGTAFSIACSTVHRPSPESSA